jgi:hypothetical protein
MNSKTFSEIGETPLAAHRGREVQPPSLAWENCADAFSCEFFEEQNWNIQGRNAICG